MNEIPEGVSEIIFGKDFNKNIDKVIFPASLQSITFGELFDQNIDKVVFPKGFQAITNIFFNFL